MRQSATIIVSPPLAWNEDGISHTSNPRDFHKVDRFAAAISEAAGFEVPIIEGSVEQAPESGFLFLYESSDRGAFSVLGPRIILVNANRGEIWSGRRDHLVTDVFRLAAAIEMLSYFQWETGSDGPSGVHGLMSVAQQAGMKVGDFRSPSSDYGILSCHGHCHSMAELLIHYLTVYEEMGLQLR